MMKPCKRMLVQAKGIDSDGNTAMTTNGNYTEGGCTSEVGKCGCTHAEVNLLQAMPHPKLVWVSHSPCLNCAKELLKSGVPIVIYENKYRIEDGIKLLQENGVEVKEGFYEYRKFS